MAIVPFFVLAILMGVALTELRGLYAVRMVAPRRVATGEARVAPRPTLSACLSCS